MRFFYVRNKEKPMDPMTKTTTDEGVELDLPQSQKDSQVAAEQEKQLATEQPEATPEPTPEPEAQQEPEPEINEREAKLEAIAQKRLADMAQPEQTAVEPEADPETEGELETEEQAEKAPRTHKIKVDGEERNVTFEEMRAMAQKGAAADKRFQAAAEKEKSIEQRMKEFEDKLAQQSSVTPSNRDVSQQQALPKDKPIEITPDAFDKAVFGGDEEGARYREEMAKRLNRNVDPTAIKNEIRAEMRVESAIESVSKADPIAAQILSDNAMKQTANEYSAMLLRLEPNLSEAENIAKACQQARIHFPDLQAPESTPEMAPAKQVAQTKKAHSAGNVSSPAQRINVAPAPLTQEQIRAQGRSQLRQSRGL